MILVFGVAMKQCLEIFWYEVQMERTDFGFMTVMLEKAT